MSRNRLLDDDRILCKLGYLRATTDTSSQMYFISIVIRTTFSPRFQKLAATVNNFQCNGLQRT